MKFLYNHVSNFVARGNWRFIKGLKHSVKKYPTRYILEIHLNSVKAWTLHNATQMNKALNFDRSDTILNKLKYKYQ